MGHPMTRCAVVGHPVAHSLSPVLHAAAYDALGLDWSYSAQDVAPGGLADFVADLGPEWHGLSITAPHKDDAVALGEADEVVRLAGAANTWVRTQDGPIVRNTDVPGYGLAFAAHGVSGIGRGIVVGNGATARSALLGLHEIGAKAVTVLARRPERAADLLALGRHLGMDVDVQRLEEDDHSADVLVSTIPAAGASEHAAWLAGCAPVVFDSVYDPWPTALAAAAAQQGAAVLNGLDLLAGQAVEQVRWMTGEQVSFELLRAAARDGMLARTRL